MFTKYHSLENDFILFDLEENKVDVSSNDAKKLCNRHTGIGADGVLLIISKQDNLFLTKIYNADGSDGGICLNGARCIADYLFQKKDFPDISIVMGRKKINHRIDKKTKQITQQLDNGIYIGDKSISCDEKTFSGSIIDVGNPHFIVFKNVADRKDKSLSWLKNYGHLIEKHATFPKRTNVEFVWKRRNNEYEIVVYERGCGITHACSSGAAAITWLLFKKKEIDVNEKIRLCMLGGVVTTWITSNENIALKAQAHLIFKGTFS